ncbi:MAG: hypothetical protein HC908_10645 [Calothrix sp. SM1_7_51]|nr:hypothetical protein [Calothrix sp. SM1_7_51]
MLNIAPDTQTSKNEEVVGSEPNAQLSTPNSKSSERQTQLFDTDNSQQSNGSTLASGKTEALQFFDFKNNFIEINSFCRYFRCNLDYQGCILVAVGFEGSNVICSVYELRRKHQKPVMENVSIPPSKLLASCVKYPDFHLLK